MRLIDADKFIGYLGLDAENSREDNLGEIVTLEDFDRQPTALDVDEMMERLDEYARGNICRQRTCIEGGCENCGAMGAMEVVQSCLPKQET